VIRSVNVEVDQPALRWQRLNLAVKEVLGDLQRSGSVVPTIPADGGGNDVLLQISDTAPGGSGQKGGEALPLARPVVAESYRLSLYLREHRGWLEVSTSLTAGDIAPVLGDRGLRCWAEALDAFKAGLYLSASSMAAAPGLELGQHPG
jgi:hypothetical protein